MAGQTLPVRANLFIPQGRTYRRRWTWLRDGEPEDLSNYTTPAVIVTRPKGRVVLDLEPFITTDADGHVDLELPATECAKITRKCVWSLDLCPPDPSADCDPFLAGGVYVTASLR